MLNSLTLAVQSTIVFLFSIVGILPVIFSYLAYRKYIYNKVLGKFALFTLLFYIFCIVMMYIFSSIEWFEIGFMVFAMFAVYLEGYNDGKFETYLNLIIYADAAKKYLNNAKEELNEGNIEKAKKHIDKALESLNFQPSHQFDEDKMSYDV